VATRPNLLADFGTPGLLAGVPPTSLDFAGSISSDGRTLFGKKEKGASGNPPNAPHG
jgi:hypothetical protein